MKKMKGKNGITLVALVVTIIILLILAGISISTIGGKNGLFNTAKKATEEYKISEAKEQIIMAIMDLRIEEENKGDKLDKEDLPRINNEKIDVGDVSSFPVEVVYETLLFNINESYVVAYVSQVDRTIVTYTTDPESYTNRDSVSILINVKNAKGIKTIEYPDGDKLNVDGAKERSIDYTVTANGTYTFKITDVENKEIVKDVVICQIDKLAPNDFTITVSEDSITGTGFIITGNTTDVIDETGVNAASGIARYEYYVNGIKYDKNEITGLEKETTYTVYVVAYDKAGNASNQTPSLTVTTTKDLITVTASEIAANPKGYYGKKVENYKANSSDTNTYRIFYVDTAGEFGDKNTIYLKADFFGSVTPSSSMPSTPTTQSIEMVKKLNPDWAKNRGSLSSSWNDNEKAAAYLCDPEITTWKDVCYNEEYANYVVGSPSVEMYVKSYNQAFNGISGTYTLGARYRATDVPGYIYTINGSQSISGSDYFTAKNTLNYTEYNSMYCGKNGTKTGDKLWLASPSSNGDYLVCYVVGDEAFLNAYNYARACVVSPLVSLKPEFQVKIEK